MNFLLNADVTTGVSESGNSDTVMLIILGVLALLCIAVFIFKRFFQNSPDDTSDIINDDEAQEMQSSEYADMSSDDEIIAVIAAAIAAAESESSGLKYRVVSFKRI